MDQNSQQKVIKAGFTILRCDDQPCPRIKYKDKDRHEWATAERFNTKAERDRRFKQLMGMEMIVSD